MLSLLVALACSQPAPAPPVEPPPQEEPAPPADTEAADQAAIQRAQAATGALGQALKARLGEAVGEGGPVAGVSVCAGEAAAITARVAEEQGVRVGRSAPRLRNPANDGPPWVTAWLGERVGKAAAEVEAASWVEDTEAGRVARVVKPLPTGAMCVACHGPSEQIPAEIQAVLAERYPDDAATGFAQGDLRGVIWAEAAVAAE